MGMEKEVFFVEKVNRWGATWDSNDLLTATNFTF